MYNVTSSTITSGYNLFGHSGESAAQAFSNFTPNASDIDATSDGDSVALASILESTLADNDTTVLAGKPPGRRCRPWPWSPAAPPSTPPPAAMYGGAGE